MKKRLLSMLLVLSMFVSLLPQTVFAAEEDDSPEGLTIVIDDVHVVVGGQVVDSLPAGVSFSRNTLTLDNASLGMLRVHGDDATIALRGSSTIRNDGRFVNEEGEVRTPVMTGNEGENIAVTITGPGSLEVDSSGTDAIRTFVADYTDLTITDGAEVTVRTDYEGHGIMEVVSGSLTMNGGASLTVDGPNGIWMGIDERNRGPHSYHFTDCTVTASRLTVNAQVDGVTSQVTVGKGAEINLSPFPVSNMEVFGGHALELRRGSSLLLDGGEINVDTYATPAGDTPSVVVADDGSLFELRSGTLNIDSVGNHGMMIEDEGAFLQTGGTLKINSHGDNAGGAFKVHDGSAAFRGGTASLTGLWGVVLNPNGDPDTPNNGESTFTVNGGALDIRGEGGQGVSLRTGATLNVLDGTMSVSSRKAASVTAPGIAPPITSDAGTQIHFLGGTVNLDNESEDLAMMVHDPVVFGEGVTVVDNNTGEPLEWIQSFNRQLRSSSVTISGERSFGTYGCALAITSGAITQGARFNVRAVVTLGAETGQVAFPFPEDMAYVPGSLTVDGKTAEPVSTTPLTVSLEEGGIIRFSAVADNTGAHTLTANTTAGGETHKATLPFTVDSFNLSLPTRTARLEIPVAGNAVPGSTVTFYEGEEVLGEATTTVLGTWSGTVTLPDAVGEHTVYAQVTPLDGESFRSDDHKITYAPETDEVKTLTVKNYVHGRTSADPPVEETLVIDYVTGENSASYYTYWPDLPTFEYRVDFVEDASAQKSVAVITYDRLGDETRVPLRYKAAEDAWFGEHDYTEWNIPARFQVEFVPGGADDTGLSAEVEVEPAEPEEPETPEEELPEEPETYDNMDGAFAVGGEDFTFLVSDTAGLAITDGWGEAVSYTSSPSGESFSVDADFEDDGIYVAELTSGEFTDYPDVDALYIIIEGMSEPKPAEVVYSENVKFVDELPQTGLVPGDVYVVGDHEEAWGVTEDGELVEAGINNVFERLSFTQADIDTSVPLEIEGLEEIEAELAESFAQSGVYQRIMLLTQSDETFEQWEDIPEKPDVEITTGWKKYPDDPYKRTLVLKDTYTIPLSNGRVTITKTTELDLHLRFNLGWGFWRVTGPQEPAYIATKATESFDIEVFRQNKSKGLSTTEDDLLEFFHDDAAQRILEIVEVAGPWDVPTFTLEIPIPIGTTPLKFIAGLGLSFDGLTSGFTSTKGGISVSVGAGAAYINNKARCFGSASLDGRFESMSHTVMWQASKLRINMGLKLFALSGIIYTDYIFGGLSIGHGRVDSENGYMEEEYGEVAIVLQVGAEIGIGFGIPLPLGKIGGGSVEFGAVSLTKDFSNDNWKLDLFRKSSGTKEMPIKFTVIEEKPVMIQNGDSLLEKASIAMDYMDFSALKAEERPPQTIPVKSREFGLDRYWCEVVEMSPEALKNGWFSMSPDGRVKIYGEPTEEFYVTVKVHFKGLGEEYDLWKIVTLCYSPAQLTIHKEAPGTLPIATFSVYDKTTGEYIGTHSTDASGVVTIPIPPEHEIMVEEIAWPAGYMPLAKNQTLTTAIGKNVVSFINVPVEYIEEEPILTPEVPIDGSLDPSGFVYEGIASNRLSGVTTTLYFSDSKTRPTGNASESQKWDAAAFQQQNPLTTDTAGQYMWLVPDGWWQVKYEKAGYATAYSDWLPVPPVQTEVNQALVSTAPAKLALSADVGDNTVILRFDRPVRLSTVTAQTVTITGSGALTGELSPVDAGAAADGQACATTFYFRLSGGQSLKDGDTLSASYNGVVTYAGAASSGSASAAVIDPMPFSDVSAGAYFYDSVLWAVNHSPQITTGTNAEGTLFSPDNACTRAQVVTFLWRAMGQPEPESTANPFTDVEQGSYYYKAVLWAVENGITTGTNAEGTLFSPDAICTRGQIVTFLHRTEKTPEPTASENPFQDVSASAYYYDAVLWAVEWGITNGTNAEGTLFSPDATCTRGQIVTFLYRDMK